MNLLHGSRFSIKKEGVTITPGAYNEVADKLTATKDFQRKMGEILSRHICGDWGDVCAQDAKANEDALKSGARILSAYTVAGIKLWVISDAAWNEDSLLRQVTTILRPEDY
jgi:hypothetical protein